MYGRIIGVADAFDAMTANRIYWNQMDISYVLNELKKGRGTQFDPTLWMFSWRSCRKERSI